MRKASTLVVLVLATGSFAAFGSSSSSFAATTSGGSNMLNLSFTMPRHPLSMAYNMAVTDKAYVTVPARATQDINTGIYGTMTEQLTPMSVDVAMVRFAYRNFRGEVNGKPIPQMSVIDGLGFSSRVNREGQVTGIVLTGLQKVPAKTRVLLSGYLNSLKQTSQSIFPQVPKHPVKVGQSWAVQTNADISGLAVSLHYVYTYEGTVHGDPEIAVRGTAAIQGPKSPLDSATLRLTGKIQLTPTAHLLESMSINEIEDITVTSASGTAKVQLVVNTSVQRAQA